MSSKKYDITYRGVMNWAKKELEGIGYLIGTKNSNIQYSYAQSKVNSMAHLRDALLELVKDPRYKRERTELVKVHDKVIRVMNHLVSDFNVDLNTIKQFNTRHILGNMSYLKKTRTTKRSTKNATRRRT
jgi:hypothetical protein